MHINRVLLLAIVAAASYLPAQQPRRRITFDEILRREDADDNGEVTKAEFKGPAAIFTRGDLNGDGVLTRDEYERSQRMRRQPRAPSVPDDVQMIPDVVFGTGGTRELKMHVLHPKEPSDQPRPVFVWIHGGGWRGGNKESGVHQVLKAVRLGFVGATVEYRLTGEAAFPAQIEDCKCAIRYLRAHSEQYNIDVERIAVAGSSAGGHLAALVGTSGSSSELKGTGGWPDQSSRVHAVIDLYGPTDFEKFVTAPGYESHNKDGSPESRLLGGGEVLANPEGIRRVNPITYIDDDCPPFLIIHGDADRTVPLNQSEALHQALLEQGIESTLRV